MFLIYSFVFLSSLLIKASEKFLYIAFYCIIPQYISFLSKPLQTQEKMKFFGLLIFYQVGDFLVIKIF